MRHALAVFAATIVVAVTCAYYLFDPLAVRKDDGGGGGGVSSPNAPAASSGPTSSDVHVDSIMGGSKKPRAAACKRCGKVHPTVPPASATVIKTFDPFNLGQTACP